AAGAPQIEAARQALLDDNGKSRFHFRDYFPPQLIEGYEVRWYRPLVAWRDERGVQVDTDLAGVVRASRGGDNQWLRAEIFDRDGIERELAVKFDGNLRGKWRYAPAFDVQKILEMARLLRRPISGEMASVVMTPVKDHAPVAYASWRAKVA